MKKLFFTAILAFVATWASAQSTVATQDIQKIPAKAVYEGELIAAKTWQDASGSNLVILSRTKNKDKKTTEDMESTSASLFVYYYAGASESQYKLVRKIQDFVKDCPLDLTLSFIESALTFTDLDKDKKTEITFVYRLACRGDVSGAEQKVIMLEGADKYAIRGTCSVVVGENEDGSLMTEKGTSEVGAEFKKAPKFLEYAQKIWQQYEREEFN